MGRLFLQLLSGDGIFCCAGCGAHLCQRSEVLSRGFHGRTGKAYLFDRCYNVEAGPSQQRLLMTGWHRVADIHCVGCDEAVGWTYYGASDPQQRYKVGRFVMEIAFLKPLKPRSSPTPSSTHINPASSSATTAPSLPTTPLRPPKPGHKRRRPPSPSPSLSPSTPSTSPPPTLPILSEEEFLAVVE